MRLLLDQGLPRSTADVLIAAGHDAVHVGSCGLAKASDAAILEAAREQGRVVVTLDADFHALLALSGEAGPSVMRLRIEGLRAEPAASAVLAAIKRCEKDLAKGALISVFRHRMRVRALPIRRLRRN